MASRPSSEVLWEAFQTVITSAIPYLVGRFSGRASVPPPTTSGGQVEKPLEQQTTNILKPRNDEAIQLAVDAALRKLPDGAQYVKNIQAVREALEPHQQTDWRKNLGTHELTERFEHVMVSETITRGGNRGQTNQAGASQPQGGGQEKIERKFDRRPRDYELTAKDPRVMHLVLVSKVVSGEATPEQGIATAKRYLLSAGLISKQSVEEKAAAAARQGEEVAVNAINRYVAGVKSDNPTLIRLEAAIKAADNATAKRQAEEALRAFLAAQSRTANARRQEKNAAATLRFRALIVIVVIVVIAMAFVV